MSLHFGGSAGNDDRHHHTATSLPPHPQHHSHSSYAFPHTHPLPSSHPYSNPYYHSPAEHTGYVDYRVAHGLSSASAVPGVAGPNSSPAVPPRSASQALGAHGAHVSHHIHPPTSTPSHYTPHHGNSAAPHMPSPLSSIAPGLRDPPPTPAAPTASGSPSEASSTICFNCGASGHYLRSCTQPRLPKVLLRNVRRAMEASDRRSTTGARTGVPTVPHPTKNTSASFINTASSATLRSQEAQHGDRNPKPKQPHSPSTVSSNRQPCSTPSLNGLFMVELKDGLVVGTPKRIVTRSLSRNVQRASKKAVNTSLQPATPLPKPASQPRTSTQTTPAPSLTHTSTSMPARPSPLSQTYPSSSANHPMDSTVRVQPSAHNLTPVNHHMLIPPTSNTTRPSVPPPLADARTNQRLPQQHACIAPGPAPIVTPNSLAPPNPTASRTTLPPHSYHPVPAGASIVSPSTTTNHTIPPPPAATSANQRLLVASKPTPAVVPTQPISIPSNKSTPLPAPTTTPPGSPPRSHRPIASAPIGPPSSTKLPSSGYSYYYDSSTNSWLYYHPKHGYFSVPHSHRPTLQ